MSTRIKPFTIMKGEPVEFPFLRFPLYQFVKYNGLRAYVRNGVVYTSSNKPFPNKHLQETFGVFEGFDGEFVVGNPADSQNSLERTNSICRSKDKPIDGLKFYVFDYLGDFSAFDYLGDFSAGFLQMPYAARLCRGRLELAGNLYSDGGLVEWAEYYKAFGADDVRSIDASFVRRGFEGSITRDPQAAYKCGKATAREATMGKLKQFVDDEFEVVGWQEFEHNENAAVVSETGRTKRSSSKAGKRPAGKLGSLVCRTTLGHRFNVGSGFTDAQRVALWREKEKLLGKWAKVKYHATGTKAVPILPTFLGFREAWDMGVKGAA